MPWQNEPIFIALPDLQVSTEEDAPMFVPLTQVQVEDTVGYQFERATLNRLQDVPVPPPPPGLPPPGLSPPGLFQKKESTVDDCDSTSASSGDHDFSRIRNLIDTFGLPKDMESKGRRVDVAKGGKLIVASAGSVGHPQNCAPACKYTNKLRGCKDGANCVKCHLCEWRHLYIWHKQTNKVNAVMPTHNKVDVCIATDVDPDDDPLARPEAQGAPSIGSIGHPKNCGPACKYNSRKFGCRHGSECLCCHQCQWARRA